MSAENLIHAFNAAANSRVQASRSPVAPYINKRKPPQKVPATIQQTKAVPNKATTTAPHPMLALRIDLMAAANRKKR